MSEGNNDKIISTIILLTDVTQNNLRHCERRPDSYRVKKISGGK